MNIRCITQRRAVEKLKCQTVSAENALRIRGMVLGYNIRQRIETLYGDKASLTITEHAGGRGSLMILLPLTDAAA